jgi:hypothetical protein
MAAKPRSSLEWAESKNFGVVNELSLMTPIKPGRIPGEKRTYEERLRDYLASLHQREASEIPAFVRPVTEIHYARWIILRPEQYLQYSDVDGVEYESEKRSEGPHSLFHTPKPMDPYLEDARDPLDKPRFLSWLLFIVTFDGELGAYVRRVVQTIGEDVDKIWGNCYGYPGTKDFERFWMYARRHQIPTDAFYAAYPMLSVPRIHHLRVFKDRFDDFIARTRKPDGSSREDIGPLLDEFLRSNLQYTSDFPAAGGTYDETHGEVTRGRNR